MSIEVESAPYEEHTNPFTDEDGEACVVEVTQDVDMDLLTQEIRDEDGGEVHLALSFADGADAPSKEHPAKLFVLGASEREVKKVLRKHKPGDGEVDADEASKRLADGEDISYEELLAVVRKMVSASESEQD